MLLTDKIASLPEDIREQLNSRLHNGESDSPLVDWLNDLPRVQIILAREFCGNIISDDELAEWRYSGYEAWIIKKYESVSPEDIKKWMNEATQEQVYDYLRAHLRDTFRIHLERFMYEFRTLSWLIEAAAGLNTDADYRPSQTESPSPAR